MVLIRKVEPITAEEVLSRISEYDIYHYECPEFTIGVAFCNWMRGEKNPSLTIFLGQDGKLHHFDQGDSTYRGDCWDLVQQKYSIGPREAIDHVAKTFMLIDGPVEAYRTITSQYAKPVMLQQRHSLIQCTVRKWQRSDFDNYWGRYKVIGEQKLQKHQVYAIKELFLNRRRLVIGKNEMVFGYRYPLGWKIMFPEREKLRKWLSNIVLDTPDGLENLNKDHNSLLVKSKKCLMVMEEVYPYIMAFQNESLGSVSEKTAKYINENSKKVWYGGDSDVAGKKASYKITEKFSWSHVNVPDIYLPKKDWSDWAEISEDLAPIEQHLKSKGIMI